MNNQTVSQQRELRRYEDLKGTAQHRPIPWYAQTDVRELMRVVICYLVVVIGLPFALNWLFNWIAKLKVFL